MKAARIHQHGGVEEIRIEDASDPHPAAGEVVLDVRAAALNHLDIWVRTSQRFALDMPHVIGSDAAGVVRELGHGVHGFAVGDEVIVNPGLHCGCCVHCRAGQQSLCESFAILGASRGGTFAEQVAVPATNLFHKDQSLTWEEAAALPVAYVTAWRMLMTRAALRAGETVLIHGIGGGAALAALQLTRLAGAGAIVTSSDDQKLTRAAQLGAAHVINYRTARDLGDAVRKANGGRGVDVVFDCVGAATWELDFSVVRRGGRIVLCGVTTGAGAPTNLQALYWNQISVLGSTFGSVEDFRQTLEAMRVGGVKPVIDSVFPLDQARQASARMEEGKQFGKIVLKVSE